MRTRVFSPNTPVARSIPDTEVVLTPASLSRLTDLERDGQTSCHFVKYPTPGWFHGWFARDSSLW